MKTLLVDDEPLARVELRRLLRAHPEIEIAGEAADAEEARAVIASDRPDLVFLDVQMPGASGFDLLAALDDETRPLPAIIFTTAFDQFALKAFEFGAFDYLLKPIEPARLAASLRKLHARLPPAFAAAAAVADHEPSPLLPPGPPLGENDQVFVKDADRCWLVRLADVCLFESEGNYTRLHFGGRRPLALRSLNALEARLDPRVFFRVNRRQIVNLRWIERLEPWFAGGLRATLRESSGGADAGAKKLAVEISRRQSQRFRESLSL